MKLLKEAVAASNTQEIIDRVSKALADARIYPDIWPTGKDSFAVSISWGDWKHDHLYADKIIEDTLGDIDFSIEKEVTEEDGSDTYSAIHNVTIYPLKANLDELEEDVNEASLEQEIRRAIRDLYPNLPDEDYNDLIGDYLVVETKEEDGRTKVEVRAELSYTQMDKLANKIDPIIQKYDDSAYFDHEDAGIISAYLDNKLIERIDSIDPIEDEDEEILSYKGRLAKHSQPDPLTSMETDTQKFSIKKGTKYKNAQTGTTYEILGSGDSRQTMGGKALKIKVIDKDGNESIDHVRPSALKGLYKLTEDTHSINCLRENYTKYNITLKDSSGKTYNEIDYINQEEANNMSEEDIFNYFQETYDDKIINIDAGEVITEDTHLINLYYIVDSDSEIKGDNLTREEARELTKQLKDTAKDYIYVTRNATYDTDDGRIDDYDDIVDVDIYGAKFVVHKDLFNLFKNIDEKLIKSGSEEAFKKNVETEIKTGKDPKQAVAIAHSVKRKYKD